MRNYTYKTGRNRRSLRLLIFSWLALACLLVGCRSATESKKMPSNPYIKPPKEEQGLRLGSWFQPKRTQRPDSVTDFLRQERP